MERIYDLVFTSIVEKGEKFTFKELLSVDENQAKFNNMLKAEAEIQASTLVVREKSKLQESFEERKNLLDEEFRLKIAAAEIDAEKIFMDKISRLEADLEVAKKSDENLITELRNQVRDLKEFKVTIEEQVQERIKQIQREANSLVSKAEAEASKRKSSAISIGELGEQEIRDQLKKIYPSDKITKPAENEGGADIDQTFVQDGSAKGTVLFEIKNRDRWEKKAYLNFTQKVQNEQHDYFIYVHNKVPSSKAEGDFIELASNLTYDRTNKIYITNFETVIPFVHALRTTTIRKAEEIQLAKDRDSLQAKIFEFVTSEDFRNYFSKTQEKINAINKVFENIVSEVHTGKALMNVVSDTLSEVHKKTLIKVED